MFRRVIIKLSGEALSSEGSRFDDFIIGEIVSQIKTVSESGTQVSLVVGGGNIWRGRQASPSMDRVKADQIGMLATVMNAIYLQDFFLRQSVDAVVMTPAPISNMTRVYERDEADRLLNQKTVIINAAGLCHPIFSTDTVAALRAAELSADCVLYAKYVDGVYEADPKKNPSARKYKFLSYGTALSASLNAADMAAMHLSNETGVPSFVFKLNEPGSVVNACAYPETGTLRGTYIDKNIKEEFYV